MRFVRDFVFDARENAEFAFDGYVIFVGVVDNLGGELHVLVVGERRTVDHDGREAVLYAGLAQFKRVAVVEVQNDRNFAAELLCVFGRALGHVAQKRLVGVLARAARNLKDYGRFCFDASLDDGLHLFHVVEVKRGDRIFACDSLFEKLA